jgi:hypothetical protein
MVMTPLAYAQAPMDVASLPGGSTFIIRPSVPRPVVAQEPIATPMVVGQRLAAPVILPQHAGARVVVQERVVVSAVLRESVAAPIVVQERVAPPIFIDQRLATPTRPVAPERANVAPIDWARGGGSAPVTSRLPVAPARMPVRTLPRDLYVIPRCYAGDRMPDPKILPPGCNVTDVKVIHPGT